MARSTKDERDGFTIYEKMPEDTNCWQTRGLKSIKKWVATEKVHGANFSFTVTDTGSVKAAKRGGYLGDKERFFGVHQQRGFLKGERERVQAVFHAVRERFRDVSSVTVYGELFGGCYPHPSVPPCHGVIAVQTEVVYCPELRFIVYDIAMHRTQGREYVDYDDCMEIFKSCGLLYAEPLCVGTFQDMISYPLGFQSTLPKKFGLPPLDGRANTAEGIVIKPLKNTVLDTSRGPRRVIFKRKVENFQERKVRGHPNTATKGAKRAYDGELEALKYEMYALVTDQRIVSMVSKLGMPENEDEWEELVEGLVCDVVEEMGEVGVDGWERCEGDSVMMEEVVGGLREECQQAVQLYRENTG